MVDSCNVQYAFPRFVLFGHQTTTLILSFFRNVVTESNQIDSLKNLEDDSTRSQVVKVLTANPENITFQK